MARYRPENVTVRLLGLLKMAGQRCRASSPGLLALFEFLGSLRSTVNVPTGPGLGVDIDWGWVDDHTIEEIHERSANPPDSMSRDKPQTRIPNSRRRADCAARWPHMPWTPPPGGVDDEHR